ncbi:LOW QUALITY PROTEIN: transmembrane protein 117-like [Rhynchonycteris naso]
MMEKSWFQVQSLKGPEDIIIEISIEPFVFKEHELLAHGEDYAVHLQWEPHGVFSLEQSKHLAETGNSTSPPPAESGCSEHSFFSCLQRADSTAGDKELSLCKDGMKGSVVGTDQTVEAARSAAGVFINKVFLEHRPASHLRVICCLSSAMCGGFRAAMDFIVRQMAKIGQEAAWLALSHFRIAGELPSWVFPGGIRELKYSNSIAPATAARTYIITDYMGIRNESCMKLAAVGTWMEDFVTAMVTDMMLHYTGFVLTEKSAGAFWKKGNVRIVSFWTVLFTLTSVVVLVITTDWISWDKLNRGFLPSDEVSRAFLASFILVFDLLIVMQPIPPLSIQDEFLGKSQGKDKVMETKNWKFPHLMGDVDVNLPGLHTPHMQFKIPFFQKIFKEEYRIHITGKWFNYEIIFLVLILDLNMWKNQIFYKTHEYGQYIGPGQKIYTVKDSESLKDLNRTKLSWEWRSNHTNPQTNKTYAEEDLLLHSRFTGASLDVKCLAFVPSLIAFVWFGFFIWFFGRFLKNEQGMENQDKTYTHMKRKSLSEHSKDMGITRNTQASVEDPLNDPPLVCIRSDFNEIVYKSSHLTSENLSSHLNEPTSATEANPDLTTYRSTPMN